MEPGLSQLLIGLMGGGLVALIPVIVNAIKQLSQGRMAKEDMAIQRWKQIADEKQKDAETAWRIVEAFRKWYHLLWTRYVRITGDEDTFPSDPVQEERNRRKENDRKRSEEHPPHE